MTHPLVRSWQFAWTAEGRSSRTLKEMTRHVERFAATLDKDLTTATRADCEAWLSTLNSPFVRNISEISASSAVFTSVIGIRGALTLAIGETVPWSSASHP